ncbi:MAG: hypothetical protein ACODAU_07655 [Myxococcota bacterium]
MRNRFGFGIIVSAFALAACGGGAANAPNRGPMPEGGDYTGVWFSPQYGEMHLHQNGDRVVGWYQQDERQGRISGTVAGNVLRFEWEEEREMVTGKPTVTRGRGYFVYTIDHEERGEAEYEVHSIEGEWGMDDSDTGGGPWTGVKSLKRKPRMQPQAAD